MIMNDLEMILGAGIDAIQKFLYRSGLAITFTGNMNRPTPYIIMTHLLAKGKNLCEFITIVRFCSVSLSRKLIEPDQAIEAVLKLLLIIQMCQVGGEPITEARITECRTNV